MSSKPSASTTVRRAPENARKSRAWRKLIPWVIGLALIAAIVAGLRPKPLEIDLAKIENGPLTVSVLEEGKTRIRHRYVISPPVAGMLRRIPIRAGEKIQAATTILAVVEPQSVAFLDARAQAQAEARLKATEASKLQRESDLERLRAALSLADKDLVRARQLKTKGIATESDWDNAENRVQMLQRELRSAEFAIQVAEFERAQAAAALLQGDSTSASVGQPISIISPVDGFVLNVFEESARPVTAGLPLLEVGDPADLEAEIELLSSDAVAVQPGAEVSIEQWGGDRPLRGKVTLVEPGGFTKVSALGVEEQRVKVRVAFVEPIPDGRTLGDRFRVEARIVTWHADSVPRVPTGALFRKGNDWMVFTVEAGQARATKVEIAHQSGPFAELRSGLPLGAPVILHPPDTLTDHAAVAPRRAAAR